jgi:hypothetical protein
MLIRSLDPRTASPVALDPCDRRRRAQRVSHNAAIGAESSRANDQDANDLDANDLDANDLGDERAHVVAVECNTQRTDRSRRPARDIKRLRLERLIAAC